MVTVPGPQRFASLAPHVNSCPRFCRGHQNHWEQFFPTHLLWPVLPTKKQKHKNFEPCRLPIWWWKSKTKKATNRTIALLIHPPEVEEFTPEKCWQKEDKPPFLAGYLGWDASTKNPCKVTDPCIFENRYTPENKPWTLKIMISNRDILFQVSIFRCHVTFRGVYPKKSERIMSKRWTRFFFAPRQRNWVKNC